MHSLNLSTLHQSHLEYLTGCRYAVLVRLAAVAKQALFARARGRPHRHGPLAMVGLVLMKLRHNLTLCYNVNVKPTRNVAAAGSIWEQTPCGSDPRNSGN